MLVEEASLSIAPRSHGSCKHLFELATGCPVMNGTPLAVRNEVIGSILQKALDLRSYELKARTAASDFSEVPHIVPDSISLWTAERGSASGAHIGSRP